MSRYGEYYKARDVITGIVRSDLIGPVFEDEVINEPPTSYYIMGKLYPRTDEGITEDDNTTSADVESAEDAVLSSTNVKEPRSMGITFTVKEGVKGVNIKIDYAYYTPYSLSEAEKLTIEFLLSGFISLMGHPETRDNYAAIMGFQSTIFGAQCREAMRNVLKL